MASVQYERVENSSHHPLEAGSSVNVYALCSCAIIVVLLNTGPLLSNGLSKVGLYVSFYLRLLQNQFLL